MNNSYHFCLIAVMAAGMVCAEANGKTKQAAAENRLCIHFYNLAAVPRETTEHAILRVSRALAQAGIRTTWEYPPANSEEAHILDLNDSAGSFRSVQRPCLVVTVVPDVLAGAYGGAMGFALPRSRSGIDVNIVYSRIDLQAVSAGVRTEVILAYVMAHEIGHVLLRSSTHSSAGIMQPKASDDTLRLASLGIMQFLPDEAKQMRKGLWRTSEPMLPLHGTAMKLQSPGLTRYCQSPNCP